MKMQILIILIVLEVLVVSCFKEDIPVQPYIPPENVETVSLQSSIYTHQIYFDLSTGTITGENENSDWVLSFECAADGWHIRINSSDFWGVAPTGSTNFDSVFSDNPVYLWSFDASDGNPDSTAIDKWVDFNSGLAEYSNEVYLIGKYNGISYESVKKVQFFYVDELIYKFKVGEPDESHADTVQVIKDDYFSFIHYSFLENKIMNLEPAKDEWDILFTQYSTILYTDEGVPTPYFVRGVLQNPYNIESALDTIVDFNGINYSYALMSIFSTKQDAIGHDWKDVNVDEGSNTAEYKVRPAYTYIIKDTHNDLYKFRFKSYFNTFGVKGFPSFEFSKLIPE